MEKLPNFAGLTGDYSDLERSRIVILPVPFDLTSSWIKGSDLGPKALLEASKNLELYDIETESEVYDLGIHTSEPINAGTSEEMVKKVGTVVESLNKKGKFTVIIGGEHSVSIGAIKSHAKGGNITIVQLDAHSDLRDEYEGDKYSHACVMARAKEVAPIVQIGIRSMDSSELSRLEKDSAFFAKDVYDNDKWIDKAIGKCKDKVYVTIDLDVFDPSIMPSTGTPEPGGLDWYLALKFLKKLSEKREIVGFDIVELCPNPQNKAPDFMAAKLVYTLLSYIFGKEAKAGKAC
ncbi:MAG: agmatinase [Candidatus Aenigmatarchaeota archaeon]